MTNVVQMERPQVEPDSFEAWWESYPYPRRTGKALAKIKWDAITGPGLKTRTLDRDSNSYVELELRATPEELLTALKKYAASQKKTGTGEYGFKDDGKYICLPNTWLNQGRWMDF